MSINIFFSDLTQCPDPEKYVSDKLSAVMEGTPHQDLAALVQEVLSREPQTPLPLAASPDLASLTEGQQRSVGRKTRLFVAAVDRFSPLLDDERRTKDDVCTFLTETFRGYPKHTPVLTRSTDHATVDYIFEHVRVDPYTGKVSYSKDLAVRSPPGEGAEAHVTQWMDANIPTAAGPKPEELLGQLTKGLLGLLPGAYGKVAVALFGLLLPSNREIDYEQLLDDIGRIVEDANRRQTIATQGGTLNGVVAYIMGNYMPQRDSGRSSKRELFSLLNPQLADIYKVIGVLKQEEYRKGGISTFISAVTHKYLVYQEMALQDPTVKKPTDSSKAESIRNDVPEDSRHAVEVLDELQKDFDNYLNDWVNKVTDVTIRITDCPKNQWYFRDLHTGYQSPYFEQFGCKDDPHASAVEARKSYLATIKREYRKDHQDQLPWMRAIAEDWEKLKEAPIPAPALRGGVDP